MEDAFILKIRRIGFFVFVILIFRAAPTAYGVPRLGVKLDL